MDFRQLTLEVAELLDRPCYRIHWHFKSTAFTSSRHVASHIQQQIHARPQRKGAFILTGTYQLIAIAVICLKLLFLRFGTNDDWFRCRHDLLVVAYALEIAKVPWQRPIIRRDN